MGKRTWRKAMQKSARRMGIDLTRITDPTKRSLAWRRYLKNKRTEESGELFKLTRDAIAKIPAEVAQFEAWQKEFETKSNKSAIATNKLIVQLNRGNTGLANRIVNNLELTLNENIDYIAQLERFKKKMPIATAIFIKQIIRQREHYCIHLMKIIKENKEHIAEWEQEE